MVTQKEKRIGEVIATATATFTTQCYQLYELPPLGSLVKTRNEKLELFAVVANATTTGLEPGRKAIARGKDEESEEAIYKSNPQLEKLLKSEFETLVIGHRIDGKINHFLPPVPARIHSFVYVCPVEEVKEFSQSPGFINILLNTNPTLPQNELIITCLHQMSFAHEDSHQFLVTAGKHLARLLGDYNQLKSILERIEH
ncbi:MAG: hypothetical protein JSV74_04430 [Dehalococcoidia bacterium]|nr:MAG: hypothetical protein JSV74_04430 [Dehalococcoidia bacterium]